MGGERYWTQVSEELAQPMEQAYAAWNSGDREWLLECVRVHECDDRDAAESAVRGDRPGSAEPAEPT